MATHRVLLLTLVLVVIVAILGLFVVGPSAIAPPEDSYDRTTVTVVDEEETIDVRVADTTRKRFVGLSETDSLEAGEGMLFVHESEEEHTYVMRDMDFPIDIIFIDADGVVLSVHHAPVPEGDRSSPRYTGVGKYVLEVPIGYANETGITPGDRIEIGEE